MISDALGVGLEAVDSGKFATVFRIGLRFTHWRFGSEANWRGRGVTSKISLRLSELTT